MLKKLITENVQGITLQQINLDGILMQNHVESVDRYECSATAIFNFSSEQEASALDIKNADWEKVEIKLAQAASMSAFAQAITGTDPLKIASLREKVAAEKMLQGMLIEANPDGKSISQKIDFSVQLDDKKEKIHISMWKLGNIPRIFLAIEERTNKLREDKQKQSEKNNQQEAKPDLKTEVQQPTSPIAMPQNTPETTKITTSQAALKPSFDCSKASTVIEKTICNDPLLGKLDGALSANYKSMLASNIGEAATIDLKETQRKWLTERNVCIGIQCVTDAYRKRIDEVCDQTVISGVIGSCIRSDEIQ